MVWYVDAFVVGSNAAIAPAVYEAYRQREWLFACWLVITGVVSACYHTCEQGWGCFGSAMITLKRMDQIFADMLLPLSMIYMMALSRRHVSHICLYAHLIPLGVILSIYITVESPIDSGSFFIVAVVYLAFLVGRWAVARRFPPWDAANGLVTLALTIMGVGFLIFASNGSAAHTGNFLRRYEYMHAGWHSTIMPAMYFMLRMQRIGIERRQASRECAADGTPPPAEVGGGGGKRKWGRKMKKFRVKPRGNPEDV
jgi:hypothetical protein